MRKSFVTFLLHDPQLAPKEVQELSRHADLDLTMNVYGEARQDELRDAVSRLYTMTFTGSENAHSMHEPVLTQNEETQPPLPQEVALVDVGSGARTRTLPLLDEGTALSGQISANSLQFTALSVLLEKSSDGVAGDLGRSRGTSEGREHAHSMHHPDLQLIIDAWGMLPDDVRKQMLTILRDFELLGQRDSA